jgi:hypothetical protein
MSFSLSSRTAASVEPKSFAFSYQSLAILLRSGGVLPVDDLKSNIQVRGDCGRGAKKISRLTDGQSSSASRFTAAQAGFFILSQSGERSLR